MNHISHRASSVNSPKSSQISLHNSKSDHILNFTKTNFTAKTDKASTRLALFSSSKRNAGYAKPDLFEKAAVASLEV